MSKLNKAYSDGYSDAWDDAKEWYEEIKNEEHRWEEVTVDPRGAGHTYRLAVPGGWLYRTCSYKYPGSEEIVQTCQNFVPDVN